MIAALAGPVSTGQRWRDGTRWRDGARPRGAEIHFFGWDLGRNDHTDEEDLWRPAGLEGTCAVPATDSNRFRMDMQM